MTSSPLLAPESATAETAALLCGREVAGLTAIIGGGNNRLYRVDFHDGGRAALKIYPNQHGQTRDRLVSEYLALDFLSAHAPGWTPKPIGMDLASRVAAYEWIEGTPITRCSLHDLNRVIDFAGCLRVASAAEAALNLPEAAEPILSLRDATDQVQRRLDRLETLGDGEPDLNRFLSAEFKPAFLSAAARGESQYAAVPLDVRSAIDVRRRTLNPSDFGFHNAVRRRDGTIVFVDFEYFGWDDPVKMVADFVQHPAMSLDECQRMHVIAGLSEIFADDETFACRLSALAPLIGLRWCLIMLNEFLPERWRRRVLAGIGLDQRQAKQIQLRKARRRLAAVRAYIGGTGSWH